MARSKLCEINSVWIHANKYTEIETTKKRAPCDTFFKNCKS